MSALAFRVVIVAATVALALGLAACGGASAPETPSQTAASTPTGSPSEPAVAESPSGSLDARAAVDAALAAVPGGAVIEIDRDTHQGRPVWEVVVRGSNGRGTELYIDATTGEVVKRESAEIPPYARASAPAVDVSTAMDTALSATPGTVEEAGLDREGGRTVWEVEVAGPDGRVEFYIDAKMGKIVKQRPK